MDKKVVEQVNEMTKTVLDSMIRLQEINDRTVQQLAQRQLDAVGDFMSSGIRQLKALGETRDLSQVVSKQADMAKELNDRMLEHARQTMDLLMTSRNELNAMMESNLQAILNKTKEAVEKK
ncbi:MAG: phasin family protein [Magnetococcales bacterium]|nr:phasin family protein [Magnetococcales bacterium]MBF0323164.1 phasin family protein [Magnetococcales bacterium]